MKMSKMLMPTLREIPAEAEINSHKLMLRAGLMRRIASGVYAYLPLGFRTFKKIENIIREEMDRESAQELVMSALIPAESYKETGRWDIFGPEMFRLKDRGNRDFCLGPTHEELFTQTVKNGVKSYKNLPMTLYQIQTKYRDERRPRFGVMRSREFVMKDAYSFDMDEKGLDESYQAMYRAYGKIFDRCKLDYTVVLADSGAMGGSGSQEFMVKSDIGEAQIAYCDNCGYAANDEKAECLDPILNNNNELLPMEEIATPLVKTIDQLCEFFSCDATNFAKTLIYKADDVIIAAIVRGDREINETKLQNYLGCNELEMADDKTVYEVTNAKVGFAGPIGLSIKIVADLELKGMVNFITGANRTGYHFKNVNIKRGTKNLEFVDIRTIAIGDPCPKCNNDISIARGIEVGHIFKLGDKYTKALDCTYLDKNGKTQTMLMGCYGIGVGRTMASVIEQNNDEKGIVWPMAVAPYQVIIIPINISNEIQATIAKQLYNSLQDEGIEVLFDNRKERPGVKFNDAELIGIPIRITVGKKANEGIVEIKIRKTGDMDEIDVKEVISRVKSDILNY